MRDIETITVKYGFGNRPNHTRIDFYLGDMERKGYELVNRQDVPPGCLSGLSSTLGGGGYTLLTFRREGK